MASQRKSHVFRVTGLTRNGLDEYIEASFRETLKDNFTEEEQQQIRVDITIVPSCYDPDRKRVALVQFRGGVPQFLSELTSNPLGTWQVETENGDINLDCRFWGMTQLYTPKEPVVADIIAIAGLDGHAYGSWQGRGNLGRMWLRHFLSSDLPQCRTMIYGYNSKLSSHGVDTILSYGQKLMGEIKRVRNTPELQQRPLIFIAHSFGGIIMAHCLVKAVQTREDDHPAISSLYRATYGMILFAIPHRGMMVDDFQQMLGVDGSHPRQRLLQQISADSDVLISQLVDFRNLIRDRRVVSAYEMGQTRRLVLNLEKQRWERTGEFITAVNSDSALLQLPDHMEVKLPLDADHSMIVKFDTPDEEGYGLIVDELRQFVRDAPQVVAARFAQARHRPQPCSTVPFKRDPMFVGREDVINAVTEKHAAIGHRHERVALVGLAGVGKTQTAIEYAYRVRESTPDMWVFWCHASNAARLEQDYQRIAAVAEISGRDDPKTNILQLVSQWLCNESNGRWLIVLDNADDDQIFFRRDDGQASLVTFLPQASHGSILITSRNRLAARNLVGTDGLIIDTPPMNEAESLVMLRVKIPDNRCPVEDESALVQALEYIPLAITQAAAYIANRSPLITVSAYLRLFHESESKRIRLLRDEDSVDLRRDPSIRYAVITTWQLSFDEIQQSRPAATDLLALMSMFDRQGIPEDLVRDNKDILDFHDALAPLLNYSLIRMEADHRLFDMHRLVQLSVRAWLGMHQQLRDWQSISTEIMARVFPSGDYESWTQCQSLLAHARSVLEATSDVDDDDQLNVAKLQSNVGWYLNLQGKYVEAEAMHRRALNAREKVLGHEHPDTLTSVNNLGLVLDNQGKYEEAEAMHRRALEGSEQVLGHEHPDTLTSVSNLGLMLSRLLSRQGKYEEVETMHRRALNAREKVLGREHPDTLTSVNNLGSVLDRQGKYEEAEAMHRRALEGYEKVLGHEHPDTLTSVSNLGSVLSKQEKYEEAEAMHRRDLERSEQVLGREHPDTLTSVSHLSSVLFKRGKYEEAEAMHRRALEGYEKVLGHEHPDTLTNVSNLGSVLSKQEKYEEAEAMHRRALEGSEQVLGREHPDTLISVSNLGSVLSSQGKYEEAEAMHRRALDAREKVLGREHPDTLTSVNNLGLVLSSEGKYEEAEAMLRRAQEGYEKVLGCEHPNTLRCTNILSGFLSKHGKHR